MRRNRSQWMKYRDTIAQAAAAAYLTLALAPGPCWAKEQKEPKTSAYHWSRAVESPPIGKATLEAIALDGPIFPNTRADFADLRLRTPGDQAVPFVLRKTPITRDETVVRRSAAIERTARPIAPSGLEIMFDPPTNLPGPFDAIEVATPLHNFEQQVRVFASADGQDWRPISPPTMIFDYSRLVDVRNVEVPIERTTDRHFRLLIDNVTAEQAGQLLDLTRHFRGGDEVDHTDRTTVERRPFRVDQILLISKTLAQHQTGVKTIVYPTSDFQASQDPKNKQTILQFDGKRAPITSIRLLTDETNFSRLVTLEIAGPDETGGRETWIKIASGTISRLSLDAIQKDERTLRFHEQPATKYRLIVENRDSPPVKFAGVEAHGPQYELVFLAAPDEKLMLDYGRPQASPASYDTAATEAALASGISPEPAALGPASENGPVVALFSWSTVVNDSYVIFTVMALLTIVLGWTLFRASQRIDVPPAT